MLLEIPSVLNEAQLNKVLELLADAQFVDGKLSAGMATRRGPNVPRCSHTDDDPGPPLKTNVMGRLAGSSTPSRV